MKWDPQKRILRGTDHEWAVPPVEARVLDMLWNSRGVFVNENKISFDVRADALAVQDAINRLRRELPMFSMFIVARGHKPREYRLILDHFCVTTSPPGGRNSAPSHPPCGKSANAAAPPLS